MSHDAGPPGATAVTRRTNIAGPARVIAAASVCMLPAIASAQSILERVLEQTGAGVLMLNLAETGTSRGPQPELDGSITLSVGPGTDMDAPPPDWQPEFNMFDSATSVMSAVNSGTIRVNHLQPGSSPSVEIPGYVATAANLAVSDAQVLGHVDLRIEGVDLSGTGKQATTAIGSVNTGSIMIVISGP